MAALPVPPMSQTPEVAPVLVSVVNEFPEDLYDAMRGFVRTHPHWDQYRLMQVALAGFLFQQGSRERAVARHYLDGLFDRGSVAADPPTPAAIPTPPAGRTDASTPAPSPSRPLQADGAGVSQRRPVPHGAGPLRSVAHPHRLGEAPISRLAS